MEREDKTPSGFGEETERGDNSELPGLNGGKEDRSRENNLSRRQTATGGNEMGCHFTICLIQVLRAALPDTREHIQDMTIF